MPRDFREEKGASDERVGGIVKGTFCNILLVQRKWREELNTGLSGFEEGKREINGMRESMEGWGEIKGGIREG